MRLLFAKSLGYLRFCNPTVGRQFWEPKFEKKTPSPSLNLSEVSWESATGELRVTLSQALDSSTKVSVEFQDHVLPMTRGEDTGRIWVTEVSDLSDEQGTIFVDIVVDIGNVEIRLRGWVNDMAELRHSSRGRHIADALGALGENLTSTEQQKAVAQLQKIAVILLTEPASFPDPFLRRPTKSEDAKGNGIESALEPVDPEKLIRSIDEIEYPPTRSSEARFAPKLSVVGVMRAIFRSPHDFDDEIEFAEETEGPENSDSGKGRQLRTRIVPARVANAEHRNKRRLVIFSGNRKQSGQKTVKMRLGMTTLKHTFIYARLLRESSLSFSSM